ncbi:hypothetical protein F5B21DRAFT_518773 [Xylaria acuta]|nr:hypothetical protein F5B21DRAFT_518773 [Xylaria acuta]
MPLKLLKVNPKTDFPGISRCLFESHETPVQQFLVPFGNRDQAREDAIAECAARLYSWHTEDPTSYWQKVADTDIGQLVGADLWSICENDPFAEEHEIQVSWLPDDGSRRQAHVGRRPQVHLFILFAHPDYRRQGADEMGVEMSLDSTPVGKLLYEANGFHIVEKTTGGPDEMWKEAEEKIGRSTWWLM